MSTFWIRFIQLVLSLTILVVFHECGHFLFSRLFGVRVDKFYAFFNPRFSIVRIKRVNGKIRVKFFSPNVPESYEEVKHFNYEGKEEITYKPIDIESLPEDDWRRSPENTEFGVGWVPLGDRLERAEKRLVAQMATIKITHCHSAFHPIITFLIIT